MTDYHEVYDEHFPGLTEGDFLDVPFHHPTSDAFLVGANTIWVEGIDSKADNGTDLFPDLMGLEPPDDMSSLLWMEEQSIADFLNKAADVGSIEHTMPHVSSDDTPATPMYDMSPEVLIDQLTPPDSPDMQVAPEIYFDQKGMDSIMASPLSLVDVGLILDAQPESSSFDRLMETTLNNLPVLCTVQDSQLLPPPETDPSTLADATVETTKTTCPDNFVPTNDDSSGSEDDIDPEYVPTATRKDGRRKRKAQTEPPQEGTSTNTLDIEVLSIKVRKKERKKVQNKNAATKYRVKKRGEVQTNKDEVDVLEKKNEDLRENVDQLSREIKYMRDLMVELYKARGQEELVKNLLGIRQESKHCV